MREIGFRIWDKGSRRMLCVDDPIEALQTRLTDQDRYVLLEKTGRTDNQDKPIYEGDVVVMHDAEDGEDRSLDSVFAVCWRDDEAGFVLFEEDEFEVLGNIYEQPELIEKVNEHIRGLRKSLGYEDWENYEENWLENFEH